MVEFEGDSGTVDSGNVSCVDRDLQSLASPVLKTVRPYPISQDVTIERYRTPE